MAGAILKIVSNSPGAGGDLVAMKGPQGLSFLFINYIYIPLGGGHLPNFCGMEHPGVVLVKKDSNPSGSLMVTGS